MPAPKAEAVRALTHLVTRLQDDAPIDGLERATLAATAAYALEQVGEIAELKRVRKVKGTPV